MGTNNELIRQAGAFQTAQDADALAALFKEDAVFEPRIQTPRISFRLGHRLLWVVMGIPTRGRIA